MQQVLNSRERNQAFLKFLVFFLVTIVVVIGSVFFNYAMPARENKMLKEEVETQRAVETNQQKFVARMQEAIVLLDSMDKAGTSMEQLKLQLGGKINDMGGLQEGNSTLYGKLDNVIYNKLQELLEKKLHLIDLADKASKLASVQAELDNCRRDYHQIESEFQSYKGSH